MVLSSMRGPFAGFPRHRTAPRLETVQDPNKVMDIFVRVNSGGNTLSYSDLLLSMATTNGSTGTPERRCARLSSSLTPAARYCRLAGTWTRTASRRCPSAPRMA